MRASVEEVGTSQGMALVTSLLFLLVITVISVVAANNSAMSLKMSANMQDAYRSFQQAEAGVNGALGLVGTPQDPFTRDDVVAEPFADVTNHPLRNLGEDPDTLVDVDVYLVAIDRACPRSSVGSGGTSVGILDCDYYRIESEHDDAGHARTRVEMGVVKTVLGSR